MASLPLRINPWTRLSSLDRDCADMPFLRTIRGRSHLHDAQQRLPVREMAPEQGILLFECFVVRNDFGMLCLWA